ncbi:hypothetical protein BgiBS90_015931 [Biomphalaria glabrata]|uniref:Uncharacterized protein n=1 Tax=Biomphalaria glabrata TaxID=6526 RepID=A0A2C9L5Y3_BIOGL|nr:hypothetical protein BgiBS90_015931 [Biomphalaria glabrata]
MNSTDTKVLLHDISSNLITPVGPSESSDGPSRVYDPAKLFRSEPSHVSNLAFLPILAIIVFVVCILLKAYNWSREDARFKARGDVEFGDDSEVNYGIITEGDKEYCDIDMRGDGISVYDTVNSYRSLGNGFTPSINSPQYYHDTVTSIKSLVLQRADGSQYDSVKSYKAFLEKITQDKDLAVEVKLLENYPIRSKSVEHCVVFEEESSEKSEDISSRMLKSLPLKKHIHEDGRVHQFDKKKHRHRQASGDLPGGMRKRSASNPTYRRCAGGAASLPSIRYVASSDSDDDDQQADRRKLWAERKKMSRSVSGGKISKSSRDANCESCPGSNGDGHHNIHRRKRHYSADSARRHRKAANVQQKDVTDIDANKLVPHAAKQEGKSASSKQRSFKCYEESSSENPNSSSDSNIPSDGVVSDTDDETKQNTLISNASDDKTMENDVFFSLDSGTELASSYEILQNSSQRISETKKSIAQAKEEFFKRSPDSYSSPLTLKVPDQITLAVKTPQTLHINGDAHHNKLEDSAIINHSIPSGDENGKSKLSPYIVANAMIRSQASLDHNTPLITTDNSSPGIVELSVDPGADDHNHTAEGALESQSLSSPKKVQRFHVSFVNIDLSNPQSD